jgi:sugar-specific transcriptional regulator TrmB
MKCSSDYQVLKQLLTSINLNELQADVLLAVLQTGARPASVIAKRAKIKRANCYQVLDSLLAQGLVQEFQKNNVKHFVPIQPDALFGRVVNLETKATERKKQFESALPLFAALQGKSSAQPKVRFFYGYDGIIQVLQDTIRVANQTILSLVDYGFMHSARTSDLAEYLRNEYVVQRVKNNCSYHAIVCRSPGYAEEAPFREVWTSKKLKRIGRLLDGIELSVEIVCYGQSILFLSLVGEMYAIRIDDERLAKSFREIHSLAWRFLPLFLK